MKKCYYLKTAVSLGDQIDFKGLKIILTEEIINNNPDLFIVEEEKEILFTTEDGVIYYLKCCNGKWAKIIKDKTLEDYEDLLLNSITFTIQSCYEYLKSEEPKLYYIKVLQLIADDLNEGWVADWKEPSVSIKYYITKQCSKINVSSVYSIQNVICCFKAKKLAQQAIKIMGDKINLIFE